ncbi:PHP domain-containing protein [Desulfosporosinus sp. Sb-LF]|uniref:PHP domain-containing protein n=1 Tax=Desulfosporosinus sp. Sb-LF TaxID=2560027 RepID=UPI00107F55FE|nr:PHP domain-containing protein [Desulfosporosinus sp. Sb-LF]TGE32269.1 PHP domain-containing protein [Desulfosporosinus sp. Sb-LF]
MKPTLALFEADLHCHTTASDGLLTPSELIRSAAELGLKGIGITDHDTIQGWREAEEAGTNYQLQILRGIELNTDWHGKEVHILGYEVDATSDYLNDKLSYLRQARKQRMLEILNRLELMGVHIDVDQIQRLAEGESIGRPHIAQALIDQGYVSSIREGFDRYIGSGSPAYVGLHKLTPEEGIELIREAGGVAVLAHPGMNRLEQGIPAWVEVGLQGIEVAHSEHKPEDEMKFRAIAQEFHLLATGGSDFHGEARKPGVKLGRWGVSIDVIQQILDLVRCKY